MKIIVDENIPKQTVLALRALGHEVHDFRGTAQEGMSDEHLWAYAQSMGALLITTDRGFARRRFELHAGILIIRLRHPNRERIHQRVMQAITQFTEEEWSGLTVVMRDQVQSLWRASID
jgi:predicted nuclease of predicted toxin-antitoxin system